MPFQVRRPRVSHSERNGERKHLPKGGLTGRRLTIADQVAQVLAVATPLTQAANAIVRERGVRGSADERGETDDDERKCNQQRPWSELSNENREADR